nr:EAL domain-containing protein [Lachnospiraceae bacterium]
MLFMVFISMMLIIIVFAFSVTDIVQRKVVNAEILSAEVAGLFEGYGTDEETANAIRERAAVYIEALDDVEDVYVTDKQGNCVWSCYENRPDTDKMAEFEFDTGYYSVQHNIIIEEDELGIIEVDDRGAHLAEDFYDKINFEELGKRAEESGDIPMYTSVMDFSLWYVLDVDGYSVYVLNSLPVYLSDLVGVVSMAVVLAMLIAVFALYYIVSFVGVVRSEHRTSRIIYTDMITGGNNWFYFIKKGTPILKKNRGKKKYAMIHMRMYKYRSFCTCFGVRKGEELLEKFYHVLRRKMRKKELVAYHENAEFGLLLAYTTREELVQRIEALELAVEQSIPNIKLYFGYGICEIEPKEHDIEQLYNNAFTACELLEEDAERKIAFFDEEMNKQRLWERKVEDDMENALANKEFKVYLQPKISAAEEKLAGAEALVRWIHPKDGFIPPNKFIPIFEKNGFILKLDDYMLEEVAKQQAEWISQGQEIVPISVNVSRAHFTREDLAEHICEIVDKYNVPHDVIELELTESAFFDDKKVLLNTVKKLRESGFPVSMDDFGAGYSSLNSLKELTIDVLKIDADFFRNVEEVERGMLIVSEVIDLAKKLNMKIVAEGIESRDQVDFLVQQECDLIQGYFFAKPMPVDEFVQKYKHS